MSRCRWLAAFFGFLATSSVEGQVFIGPAPPGWGAVSGRGIGFNYHRRNLSVSGFYGGVYVPAHPFHYHGYGPIYPRTVVEQRIIIAPPPVVFAPRRLEYDLSGIDLDVEPPEKLDPRWPNVPPAVIPPAKKPAAAPHRPMPPAEEKAPERPKEPPPKKQPPAPPQPQPDLETPRAEPVAEARRLFDLGHIAFQNQEYGLAALRFRQATDIDPAGTRAPFLLSQAYFALAKYKEAAKAIENGMRRQPNWPLAQFQPRVDLYAGIDADWFAHKKQLEDVVALHPKQPAYLFLLGHQLWFDGLREDAAALFRRARPLVADTTYIDAFLDFAPPEPVALK